MPPIVRIFFQFIQCIFYVNLPVAVDWFPYLRFQNQLNWEQISRMRLSRRGVLSRIPPQNNRPIPHPTRNFTPYPINKNFYTVIKATFSKIDAGGWLIFIIFIIIIFLSIVVRIRMFRIEIYVPNLWGVEKLLLVYHVLVKILILGKGGRSESTFKSVKLHFVLIFDIKMFLLIWKKQHK